jgi:hypothetical protein
MKWLFVPVLFAFVTYGAQAQTASNNPSTAKMGIDHTSDPEPVFVQDASKIWAQMGSVNKTTHAFTPVGGASGGGGGGGGLSEGPWGSPPPGYATYIGILADPSGNMIGPKGSIWGTPPNGGTVLDVNANVLNVPHIICDSGCSGGTGGSGSNASVSPVPGTAPTSATYVGMLTTGGGMVGVSGSPWGTAPTGLNVLGVNAQILGALPGFASTPSFNCASGCTSGGGPVTAASNAYADGALITMGTKADAAWATGSGSEIAILKTIAGSVAALPPNASTATNQTSGSQKTQIVDGGGTVIGSTSGGFNVNCIAGCSGGSGGSNASVGVVSPPAPAPTSATFNGMLVSGGNMVGASGSVWGTAPTTLSVFGVNANVLSSVLPPNAATASGQPTINADGGANAHIMNFPATQPISAAALPLPAGAATSANQTNGTQQTKLFDGTNVIGVTGHPLLVACPDGTATCFGSTGGGGGGNVNITQWATQTVGNPSTYGTAPTGLFPGTNAFVTNTVAISAAALPLPNGAAQASLQAPINADNGSQVHVMNFPATQPVSLASQPLPTGAATQALQAPLNADNGSQVHVQNFPATQAVTQASGSVASGAYAVGSLADGSIVTMGTQADAAWSGSGSGTQVAILKKIATNTTGSSSTVTQGPPGTAANAWFTKLTDGTNVSSVKAASTSPVAADPAQVVALSPNTPGTAFGAAPTTTVLGSGGSSMLGYLGTITQQMSSSMDSNNNAKVVSATNVTPINCSVSATTTAANAPGLGTANIHGFTVTNLNTTNNVGINLFGAAVIGTAPTITLNAATPSYTTPNGFGANTALSIIASATTSVACWAW